MVSSSSQVQRATGLEVKLATGNGGMGGSIGNGGNGGMGGSIGNDNGFGTNHATGNAGNGGPGATGQPGTAG